VASMAWRALRRGSWRLTGFTTLTHVDIHGEGTWSMLREAVSHAGGGGSSEDRLVGRASQNIDVTKPVEVARPLGATEKAE